MVLISPLTNGAMKQHTISLLKYGQYKVAFIDKETFSKDNSIQFDSRVRRINKGSGFKKVLWSISILQAFRMFQLIKKIESKSIFIANGEFIPNLLILSLLARFKGIRVIICWHDVTPHVGKVANYLYWLTACIHSLIANRVVVHSRYYFNSLKKGLLYRKKIFFVPLPPYGFDSNTFNIKRPSTPPLFEKKRYYVFLGRLEYYKGLHNLIRVFSKVKDKKLLISGSGDIKYINSLKSQTKHNENIFISVGYVEEGEFLGLLSESKALILPYIHASQSVLPYIAASLQVPIISSDKTGISSTVKDLGGYVYSSDNELLLLLQSSLRPSIYMEKEYIDEFQKTLNKVVM